MSNNPSLNTSVQKPKRIEWIDMLKGILFFFVIVGHMRIGKVFKSWIYSFHMPLFFYVTGFNFSIEKTYNAKFSDYFLKLFKRLLVPYLWMQLLCMGLKFITSAVSDHWEVPAILYIKGIIYGNSAVIKSPSNPLYFVLVLFLAKLLLYFIIKLARGNETATYIICLALLPLSLFTQDTYILLHINVVPAAIVFIMIGNLLSKAYGKTEQIIKNSGIIKPLLCSVLFAALGFFIWRFNGRISVHGNSYGKSFILCVLCSVSTGIALALISMKLPKLKLLTFVGMNTLFYLGIHKELILILEALFKPYRKAPLFIICGSVAIFLILVPITLLFRRFAPFVLGSSPKDDGIASKIAQYICVVAATCVPYQYFLNHLSDGLLKSSVPVYAAMIVLYFAICAILFLLFRKVIRFAFLIEKEKTPAK